MKKLLATVNIGNYLPEVCEVTYKFMEMYANKIGAEFQIITERKFPDNPILNYEKFQLYEIAQNYDWTIFLDCDAFVHPDTPDWTEFLSKDTVLFNGIDLYHTRFKPNIYTKRSGSRIGACTWNVTCSNWTYDLWTPPTDWKESVKNIQPVWAESISGNCQRDHLIDDYTLSVNIAKYGLKVKTIKHLCAEMNLENHYYTHLYNVDPYEKTQMVRQLMDGLKIRY